MPQVFISHSSEDRAVAEEILAGLEASGISCWIAPRNIEPGTDWTEAIMRGLKSSSVFLLVFTGAANQSKHVRREVGAGFDLGLETIPVRLEKITPSEQLGYYLNSVHWFDAFPQRLGTYLPGLVKRIQYLLEPPAGPGVANDPPDRANRPMAAPKSHPRTAPSRLGPKTRIHSVWIGAVLVGLLLLLICAWWALKPAGWRFNEAGTPDPKSIAVLPFDNLSADQNGSYFADGIQEDILNHLAKIAQLRVTSRTSVMQFRNHPSTNLHQIAATLGVANVLEGTVQRSGDRVRVTVELIQASDDRTLWADSFDADLVDIFAIQKEVAETVANRLRARLTGLEEREIDQKPTQNLLAYDLYLQGKAMVYQGVSDLAEDSAIQQIKAGIAKLQAAVASDPGFVLAYCQITMAYDYLYSSFDPSPENRSGSDQAIAEARRLAPELPEVSLAYANHLYSCYRDFERLRPELDNARLGLPNSGDVLRLEAYIARRQGKFSASADYFQQALRLDPNSLELIQQFAFLEQGLGRWSRAGQLFTRAFEIAPNDPQQMEQQAEFVFNRTGDVGPLKSFLAALTPGSDSYRNFLTDRVLCAIYERDWATARSAAGEMGNADTQGWGYTYVAVPAKAFLVQITRLTGDVDTSANSAAVRAELAARVTASGNAPKLLSALALLDVWLNDRNSALTEAEQAVQRLPVQSDPGDGADLQANLALVYTWSGKLDQAFAELNQLTRLAYNLDFTYGEFRTNPVWDPLRKDRRYGEILTKLKPND